jgi:dihydroorotate dehydrogenase electron transfer subunit
VSRRTLAPFGRRAAEVASNEAVGAYRLIRVLDWNGPPDPRPGQFYMLATVAGWGGGAGERPYLPRAFSYARARPVEPGGGSAGAGVALEFLLEAVGPGTERLGAVAPGEEMWITGPLGIGFSGNGRPDGALIVGGGIGVAPLLCWHDEVGVGARVLLGFRSAEHAAAARLFAGSPRVATDDGSTGRRALVTELLREELDGADAGSRTVYACGPPGMLEAVRAICSERDVPAELALESGMACGFGACFGCVVPTRSGYIRLCVDGPVLAAADLHPAAGEGIGHR